ncbi:hypothetical protein PSACC_02945 [Paramicrosporidium saccamoebae]|uniref:Uncharacterized protein n=1 Tax=Paramicrosporidium saccamoebae TaxID=1246581 RepID=A0A2H9THP4_9FUNG|nr:hypothetical protein PSACC_02945 [Paramicrosporidium saccamoebae]
MLSLVAEACFSLTKRHHGNNFNLPWRPISNEILSRSDCHDEPALLDRRMDVESFQMLLKLPYTSPYLITRRTVRALRGPEYDEFEDDECDDGDEAYEDDDRDDESAENDANDESEASAY